MEEAQPLKVPVWSPEKEPLGEIELPPTLATEPPREHLLYEIVKMQLANRRAGTAATKTRGEVRGGGKKPWRQKGTGRARSGSSRSPVWVGGAVIFGPRPRSYSYRLPRSARKAALRSALALKQRQGELFVVSDIALAEPKTKCMATFLSRLELRKSILIVIPTENVLIERTARNLPGVKVLRSEGLNVYDLLHHRSVLFTRDAIVRVSERLGS
jgi:large subunit ribosomal protein L4